MQTRTEREYLSHREVFFYSEEVLKIREDRDS